MKQSKNKIDCTPAKHEEGVAKCLIQMCKDSNAAITFFSMDCEDGYEVTISARKKGTRTYNEFSLEEFEAIKAMAEEKLDRLRTIRSSRTSSMFAKEILRMQKKMSRSKRTLMMKKSRINLVMQCNILTATDILICEYSIHK